MMKCNTEKNNLIRFWVRWAKKLSRCFYDFCRGFAPSRSVCLFIVLLTIVACSQKKAPLAVGKGNNVRHDKHSSNYKNPMYEALVKLDKKLKKKYPNSQGNQIYQNALEQFNNSAESLKTDNAKNMEQAFDKAAVYFLMQDFNASMDVLNSVKNENIKSETQANLERLRAVLSVSQIKQKSDLAEIESTYQTLIDSKKFSHMSDFIQLSQLHVLQKQYDEAEALLSSCWKKCSQLKAIGHILSFYEGKLAFKQKNRIKAEEKFLQSYKHNKQFVPTLKALGFLYEYEGETQQSIDFFEQSIKASSANEDKLKQHLAEVYLNEKKVFKAREIFLDLHEEAPTNVAYLLKLATCEYYLENDSQSEAYLVQALKQNENLATARYYLAMLQVRRKDYDSAISNFEKIKEQDAQYVDAQLGIAQALYEQNKKQEAEKHLIKLSSVQNNANISESLARFYVASGQFDKARVFIGAFLTKNSDHIEMLFLRAQALEKLKQYNQMDQDLLRVIESNPDHAQALNYLGYSMLERKQNVKDAMMYLRRAHDVAPKDAYILDSLGWAYYQQGEYKEAKTYLEKAQELDSSEAIIEEHLADTYVKLSKKSKAKQLYKSAIAKSKDAEEEKRLTQKLNAL